jgi:hypothetical protein
LAVVEGLVVATHGVGQRHLICVMLRNFIGK